MIGGKLVLRICFNLLLSLSLSLSLSETELRVMEGVDNRVEHFY